MEKVKFIYKVLSVIFVAANLLFLPFNAIAQDIPCGDQDPTQNNCPLDNGVWILAIGALILGFVHLNRKQHRRINPANQ